MAHIHGGQEWLNRPSGANGSEDQVEQREQQPGAAPQGGRPDGHGSPPGSPADASRQAPGMIARIIEAVRLTPAVAVHCRDRAGLIGYWNQACADLYGVPAALALGRPVEQVLWPAERGAEHAALVARIWADGQPGPAGDWLVRTAGGRALWIYSTMFQVRRRGAPPLIFCMDVDITHRKAAERAMYLAALVFENSRDAILLTDRARTIVAVNHAYCELTGREAQAMAGQPLDQQYAGVEDEARYHAIWAELAATGHWQGEVRGQRSGGVSYPAWLALTAICDGDGAICHYMAVLSDISARKQSEAHARHLAEHDFLTDLPNRVLLLDRLSLALTAAHRKRSMLAILFLDLDHFKQINDTLGHHAGDQLLKQVAARLVKCVRAVDTVSRQGGDEFLLILADIGGADQAAHVATTVLQALAQPFQLERQQVRVTSSIGVSLYPDDGADIDTLVRNADLAMYHAKQTGRNSFQFFSAEMNARIVERLRMEDGLRQALLHDEFVLEFQPELDIATDRLVGAEALLRWRHPELGLLPPERFIPLAEELGLMAGIGDWVLRHACVQARRWHEAGHALAVAVNLSPGQFQHKDLLASVAGALKAAALAPQHLELEVTEAILMAQGAAARETLRALRALGVRLTIDDFGTGYTRLGHLKDYPVDKLKIDRVFVDAIVDDSVLPDDGAVVKALIALARHLRLTVIAEGVETAAQLEFLRRHGCNQYQGYYAMSGAQGRRLDLLLNGVGS